MLSREATEKVVHALITSRLDNCNSLLINIPTIQVKKLQRVQNAAARIIVKKGKRHSISAIMQEIHWLPVKQRIDFKILCLTFRCLKGTSPKYLADLLRPYEPSRDLRSQDQRLLRQPRTNTRSYGDRAFAAAAPPLWNNLPSAIRICDTFPAFKSLLKTHLFRIAFY